MAWRRTSGLSQALASPARACRGDGVEADACSSLALGLGWVSRAFFAARGGGPGSWNVCLIDGVLGREIEAAGSLFPRAARN